MNATLIEKPAYPGTSTGRTVARFRLLGIGPASTESSSRLNCHIATVPPCEDEIADFDQPPCQETDDETWTEAKNQRRCDLIDRKYSASLTPIETRELARLQAQMLRYSQRVAPLPIEDARRLYQEVLAGVIASRSPTDP
jgi:hypothetical protein